MPGLKTYFCGSIRAGREDAPLYARIIDHLKTHGTVLTEHVGQPNVEISDGRKEAKFIHDRDIDWLKQADVLVAEVTKVSLGVGYEIGRAKAMNKPCLCLFRPEAYPGGRLSAMIDGAYDGDHFVVKHYSEPDVFNIIDEYMKKHKDN